MGTVRNGHPLPGHPDLVIPGQIHYGYGQGLSARLSVLVISWTVLCRGMRRLKLAFLWFEPKETKGLLFLHASGA